jgi:hypothetical protein
MATHDLHFTVQNGDGRPQESPLAGEMDHLPDRSQPTTTSSSSSLQFVRDQLKNSSHPMVIIFHLLFKAAALFFYMFGGWFIGSSGASFITLTVICILLLAADFWVVKNVTGRLLVGLRWWNKVEEDETKWIFESAEDKAVNPFDRRVFWSVLYVTPVIWAGLFLLGLLKFSFHWLLIVVMALALNLANVYGYYKCSREQAAQFQQMMQQGAQQGAMALVRSNVLSVLTGTSTTTNNNNTSQRNFV